MKIIHFNINGIRAILKKNYIIDNKVKKNNTFEEFINKSNPDIVCLNETKICEKKISELEPILQLYPYQYFSHCQTKKGYSGVAIFSKIKPISRLNNFSDDEGRLICLEYEKYYLISVYTPNSGAQLKRLEYRVEDWDIKFRKYINQLMKKKEIIIVGDLNVANDNIDIFKPEKHETSAGFTNEERNSFKKLLKLGLLDTFRILYPNRQEYTYYNYRTKARLYNSGWRIDYCLISTKLKNKLVENKILKNIFGSDHLPIEIEFNIL